MSGKKGLESIHRWKKEHKAEVANLNKIKKKIEALNDKASTDEIRVYERKLYASQENISLLEKKMIESWDDSNQE